MADQIPTLSNGMPRVDWDPNGIGGAHLSAILTEDEPIALMAADSGLELVAEQQGLLVIVRAIRRSPAPQIIGGLK
jgi:hypothetical protein